MARRNGARTISNASSAARPTLIRMHPFEKIVREVIAGALDQGLEHPLILAFVSPNGVVSVLRADADADPIAVSLCDYEPPGEPIVELCHVMVVDPHGSMLTVPIRFQRDGAPHLQLVQ
jgi:hypothetical protein